MQTVQLIGPAKIDLPPRMFFVLRVEAPLTVLDAVARARGILL